MNILVTLNSGYVYPLTVMLHSMMQTNPATRFTIYVAHSSLTPSDFAKIRASVDPGRCRIVGIAVPDSLFGEAACKKRLSKETYYRLYAAEFLPREVNRILYLDPDIVINGNLNELYYTDMGDKLFAAASHNNRLINSFNIRRLGMNKNSKYSNAGVMLINLALLRSENRTEELMDYLEENNSRLLLEDQDVFNALYSGRTLSLDPNIFNMDELTFTRLKRRLGYGGAMNFARNRTVIIHFNGKNKPWNGGYKGNLSEFFERNREGRNNICTLYREVG